MKLYLNCYVMGDGYVTKCFDAGTREVSVGSHTMGEHERNLFVRSNARLLLAYVGAGRFGFVRQIESGKKDENGRRCMIHFALRGTETEVDGMILMAFRCYQEFARAVRDMICYEESDFRLDWEKYQTLVDTAAREGSSASQKPVSLLCAEPSLEYFLKNSGMGWTESDIAKVLDVSIFFERSVGMRLYLYCATPSMGYILREIDSETGAAVHEEGESRKGMPKELQAILDNAGCRMALFRAGGNQCFIAKEVKADNIDQYGQRKTVCLATEGMGDAQDVWQLAFFALMQYDKFRKGLTDCVKVSAGITGWTVDKGKWQQFMNTVRETADQIQELPIGKKDAPYTFLVMDTSLDYFRRSTGLKVTREDVAYIYQESQLGVMEEIRKQIMENNFVENNPKELHGACAGQEAKEVKPEQKPPAHAAGRDVDRHDERIDLLEYPAFKVGAGIFAAVCIILFLFGIWHWIKGVLF